MTKLKKKSKSPTKQSKSPKKEGREDSSLKKSKSPHRGNKAKTSNKSKSPPRGRVVETLNPDVDIIEYDGDYTPPKKDPHGRREAMDMTEELRRRRAIEKKNRPREVVSSVRKPLRPDLVLKKKVSSEGMELLVGFATGGLVGKRIVIPNRFVFAAADKKYAYGVDDSVSEQVHSARATLGNDFNISISKADMQKGQGYWIPYLGNGATMGNNVGRAVTRYHGLGTYTPRITPGSSSTWVATGPFSGCYALSLRSKDDNDVVFGHVITHEKDSRYKCDSHKKQIKNILKVVRKEGGEEEFAEEKPKPHRAPSEAEEELVQLDGWVFWCFDRRCQQWLRTIVWTSSAVNELENSSYEIVEIEQPVPIA